MARQSNSKKMLDGIYAKIEGIIREYFDSLSSEKEEQVASLEQSSKLLTAQIEQAQKTLADINVSIENKNKIVGDVTSEIESLQAKKQTLADVLAQLDTSHANIMNEIDKLQDEATDHAEIIKSYETKVQAAQNTLKEVNEKIEAAELSLKQLKAQEELLAESHAAKTTEHEQYVLRVAEVQLSIEKANEELTNIKTSIAEQIELKERLSQDVINLHITKKTALDEIAAEREKIAVERSELQNAQNAVADKEKATNTQIEALEAREKAISDKVDAISRQKEALIALATDMSLGKSVDLSYVITQVKNI